MALGTVVTLTIEGKPVKVGVLRMGDLLSLQKWVKKAWAREYPTNEVSPGADRYRGIVDAVIGDGSRLKDLPADVVEKHLRESRQAALGHMAQIEAMRRDSGAPGAGEPPHFMTAEWAQVLTKLDGGLEELASVVLPRCNPGMTRDEALAHLQSMDVEQGAEFFAACFGYADDEGEGDPKEGPEEDQAAPPQAP